MKKILLSLTLLINLGCSHNSTALNTKYNEVINDLTVKNIELKQQRDFLCGLLFEAASQGQFVYLGDVTYLLQFQNKIHKLDTSHDEFIQMCTAQLDELMIQRKYMYESLSEQNTNSTTGNDTDTGTNNIDADTTSNVETDTESSN